MDNPIFGPILSGLTANLHILLPALLFVAVVRSAWFKGVIGELKVAIAIKLGLGREYQDFHNVTLEYKDGTTQFDHILLSPFGVFVLETKNYSGWIFGSAAQKTWTQKLGGKSFKFQNPLHQNAKHVNAIAEALAIDKSKIVSVIAFVGGGSIRTELPRNVCEGVSFISFIRSHSIRSLEDSDLFTLQRKLSGRRLKPGISTGLRHRKNVKRALIDPKCPICEGAMKKRVAKKGKNAGASFWGCANFPKCRGTRVAI